MTLALRSDDTHPLVAALLDDLEVAPGSLDLSVAGEDEMLGFLTRSHGGDRDRALFHYFQSGASIAGSMLQLLRWRFGDPGRIGRLLDFASGYGRVTRFLVRDIPAESVWVSDVYAGGVRFQEERFGVHGIVSAVRPEDFSCGETFGAILVTSLFTHLPEERFVAWLRVLLARLAPGGLLVFSAHSPEVLPQGEAMPPEGILFHPTSESGSLAGSDYGSTWVTEGFVRQALGRAAGAGVSLHRIERGLCNFQDLYLAVPEPGVDFSGLAFQGEPQLIVEGAGIAADGRLELRGWAAVRNGTVRDVEVTLGGERLASAPVDGLREDVAGFFGGDRHNRSGWSCSVPLPAGVSHSEALLRFGVTDDHGQAHPLWSGSIEGLLLASSRLEAGQLLGRLVHTETVLGEERARAAVEAAALRAQITAMEASRFWKLRNVWFRFKEKTGLIRKAP